MTHEPKRAKPTAKQVELVAKAIGKAWHYPEFASKFPDMTRKEARAAIRCINSAAYRRAGGGKKAPDAREGKR